MPGIEDKISRQDYLEIEQMLAKNAKRRREETPVVQKDRTNTQRRNSSVDFERVPKDDEFIPSYPKRRTSGKKGQVNTRHLNPSVWALLLAAVLGTGGAVYGMAGDSAAIEAKGKTDPNDGIRPIADKDTIDFEEKYTSRLAGMGIVDEADFKPNAVYENDENTPGGLIETDFVEANPVETPRLESPTSVSDTMIEYLKSFESFKAKAYPCYAEKWTIGWGHTDGVHEGQTTTEAEATEFLRQDIEWAENCVINKAKELGVTLTQGQFDALVDFTFNLGVGAFGDSGLMELIAEGNLDGAVAELKKYVKAKNKDTGEYVVLQGLVNRREMESKWMLS